MGVYWIPIVFALLVGLSIWQTSRRLGMGWAEWKAQFIEIYEISKEITWRDLYRVWFYEIFAGPGGVFTLIFVGFIIGFTVCLHVVL